MSDEEPDLEETLDLFADEQQGIDNAGSPAAVKKRRTRNRLERKQGAAFWRMALSTASGRRELYLLLQTCGTFRTTFACGPNGFPDERATWHAAGQRDIGERLFISWQLIDRESTFRMLDENDPRFAARPPTKADE